MRLLALHEHATAPGQGGGGAESLLRDLMASLKQRGHEVAWWQGQGSIEQAVEVFKPDVIQMQTMFNFWPNWQEIAVWIMRSGIPHVWAVMDYWPFCGGRHLLRQHVAGEPCSAVEGACDGRCTTGPRTAGWLELVNGSNVVAYNEYTAAIYNRNGLHCDYVVELGVDTELFSPGKRDAKVSIYTSSAWGEHPVKGLHVVKRAIKGGDMDVSLITGLPRERVAEALKRAHIYVFPSLYEETFGLCLCEAMASGCACIASDVAGARAQIEDGVTGLLVPPGDARALREAIEELLYNAELRERLGRAARAHVERDHTLEAMGRRWEAVYEAVRTACPVA